MFITVEADHLSPAKKTRRGEGAAQRRSSRRSSRQISAAFAHLHPKSHAIGLPGVYGGDYSRQGPARHPQRAWSTSAASRSRARPASAGSRLRYAGLEACLQLRADDAPGQVGADAHRLRSVSGDLASATNLIAAPNSINTGPFLQLELKTKTAAAKTEKKIKTVMWYDVKVSWRGGARTRTSPSRISGTAGLYVWKGEKDKWKKMTPRSLISEATIPRPDFHERRRSV